ncbi:MAG: serine/threonine-protein kinase, partial [Gemmataceae bacterium]
MPAKLLDLFNRSGLLTPAEFRVLSYCANEREIIGDTFAQWLIRNGVFQEAAQRTVALIDKGYIAMPDIGMLFADRGIDRLRLTLASFGEVEGPATVKVPIQPVSKIDPTAKLTPTRVQMFPKMLPPPPPSQPRIPKMQSDTGTKADASYHFATPRNVPELGMKVQIGSVLGRCLLTGLLGQGGHGMVYSALHQTLSIPVAVKVLLGEAEEMHPDLVRQLRREAQLLARLNHPNVIRVLDFDDQPVPYVVLEYAEGPSLADLISQTGGMWVSRAIDVFLQVAHGLKAAWEMNIVHRDIKPGNILLTKQGVAKIADLGLALTAVSGSRLVQTRQIIGTCAYMAPEQARTADEVDFRADIYSLGATFYHAVTGRLPFEAKSSREFLIKHAREELVPPHIVAPNSVDEQTSEIIMKMMAKDPDLRY